MNYFSDLYDYIRYPIASENGFGLRNAQLGAIHAIASHSTLESLDTAVVVMPTGSGKTSVLMLAPYILRKSKVLIVTPSAIVRGQISDDYSTLSTLKKVGVFDESIPAPSVFEAEHLFDSEHIDSIMRADVVVASYQVAASISENEVSRQFDYVVIDEAHHVPAPTWQRILSNTTHAASLLMTATPFRLDKKEIKGKHIYNYPLSKAYRDGIFGPITFIPIEEAPEKDRLIASEAERVFLNDRNEGYNHFLMVRTDTREKAKELEVLYKETTSLKLKRIDSSMTCSTVKRTIKLLKDMEFDGIICVDMLGEGFDFPNLKIAAIHEPQKSLASTLQFIGRFARTNAENIGTAKFIAMNDETLRIENRRLYTSDATWQDMIISMSETKIGGDIENSETINGFSRPESTDEPVSLHNVRPNCHARVYHVTSFNLDNNFPEELGVGENVYRSVEINTIVGIAAVNEVPLWLDGNQAINTEMNLFIVHYQEKTGLMFIYSQVKTENIYERIAERFAETYSKLPRNQMNRVLAGFSNYEFFNTGMQNRYAESGESYRIYAGSNTAASIDETTGKMLSVGHAFCKVTQDDMDLTIGYSSGSKFWSSGYRAIPDYIAWCDMFGEKIADRSIKVETNTNYDYLPISSGFMKYEEHVLFCFLPDDAYSSPPSIRVAAEKETSGLLTDVELKVTGTTPAGDAILFSTTFGGVTDYFSCDVLGKYRSSTNLLLCRDGRRALPLAEYFKDNPLYFKTSSGTVYYGHEVLKGNEKLGKYDQSRITGLDWDKMGVDITTEFCKDPCEILTVQDAVKIYVDQDQTLTHIFFDHGSGEVADYLTFKADGSYIKVALYHCKAMKGPNYNSRVDDVYEVAQQAVKSTVWVKSKAVLLGKIQSRTKGCKTSSLVRGDLKTLKELLTSQRLLDVTIYIVQPAISKSVQMSDTIGELLSAATFYIRHSGNAKELKVIGSP